MADDPFTSWLNESTAETPAATATVAPPRDEFTSWLNESTAPPPSESEKMMTLARQKAEKRPYDTAASSWLGEHAPLLNRGLQFGMSVKYGHAKKAIETGEPSWGSKDIQEDYDYIAAYEHLQQQREGRSFGSKVGHALADIPGIVAEAAIPGTYLAKGTMAARGIEALGHPLAKTAATAALSTPAMPSFWLPQWAEKNNAAGRDPLDLRGLPPAVGMGVMQTMVLGSLRNVGPVGKGFAGRVAMQTGKGMAEQQAVDVVASVLPDSLEMDTKFGLVGQLARGEFGAALQHGTIQALTFAAFATMHGGKEEGQKVVEEFTEKLDTAKKEGLGADKAAAKAEAWLAEKMKEPEERAKLWQESQAERRRTPSEPPDWMEQNRRWFEDQAKEEARGKPDTARSDAERSGTERKADEALKPAAVDYVGRWRKKRGLAELPKENLEDVRAAFYGGGEEITPERVRKAAGISPDNWDILRKMYGEEATLVRVAEGYGLTGEAVRVRLKNAAAKAGIEESPSKLRAKAEKTRATSKELAKAGLSPGDLGFKKGEAPSAKPLSEEDSRRFAQADRLDAIGKKLFEGKPLTEEEAHELATEFGGDVAPAGRQPANAQRGAGGARPAGGERAPARGPGVPSADQGPLPASGAPADQAAGAVEGRKNLSPMEWARLHAARTHPHVKEELRLKNEGAITYYQEIKSGGGIRLTQTVKDHDKDLWNGETFSKGLFTKNQHAQTLDEWAGHYKISEDELIDKLKAHDIVEITAYADHEAARAEREYHEQRLSRELADANPEWTDAEIDAEVSRLVTESQTSGQAEADGGPDPEFYEDPRPQRTRVSQAVPEGELAAESEHAGDVGEFPPRERIRSSPAVPESEMTTPLPQWQTSSAALGGHPSLGESVSSQTSMFETGRGPPQPAAARADQPELFGRRELPTVHERPGQRLPPKDALAKASADEMRQILRDMPHGHSPEALAGMDEGTLRHVLREVREAC